jgi:hypothetical protein
VNFSKYCFSECCRAHFSALLIYVELALGTKLAFKFKFLLLDVLDIMLELDIFVFVLELSLSVLLVLAADDSLLFEIFGFQIFSKLVNLSVQGINHLVFAFDNILKLHFLS